ncbi:MAG TPA: hypothetical protein PK359_04795 [Burkholderiaceae bacterium]|jgi:hypothetical protein|nr:hypothetical protein [Burkholderiaceae bacterium]
MIAALARANLRQNLRDTIRAYCGAAFQNCSFLPLGEYPGCDSVPIQKTHEPTFGPSSASEPTSQPCIRGEIQ